MAEYPQKHGHRSSDSTPDPGNSREQESWPEKPVIDTKQPKATNQTIRKTDPSGSRSFDEEE